MVWYDEVRLGWVNLSELYLAGLDRVSQVWFSKFELDGAKLGFLELWFGLSHH